ncbi:hypothetical protein FF011L_15930 [Roseimaritima multifibrata]|uniref:Uncharacterized protein n=1 Tax=Roseimaritima multifibrata TaxID=1930274 RepID=A0A517MD75_9BACT|nr:hypothetical protein [Roseimaritima multifibrata]QDS92844.1 hypothetical protein FF011L_15930 [Roseimaritima multifibrata]
MSARIQTTLGQLTDCENRSRRDWRDFARLWSEIKEDWQDQRRTRFEDEHLAPIPVSLNRLSAVLTELRDVLQTAEQDLRDRNQE